MNPNENSQFDDDEFDDDEIPGVNNTKTFCKCGASTSFGCEDQCRVCFYRGQFLAKSEKSHLAEANVPPKTARRALKLGLHLKNNQKAYPGRYIPESLNTSLFLYGEAGVGKTTLAISAMLYHMYQVNTIKEHFKKDQTFWFEAIPDMIVNLRKSFKLPYQEEIDIFDKYKNVDYLILDDFGVEKSSDFVFTSLYSIISHRYEEDKLTIFTSNFNLDQLAEKNNDERITRRISDWCRIIELS